MKYNFGEYVSFRDHFGKKNKGIIVACLYAYGAYYIRANQKVVSDDGTSENVEHWVKEYKIDAVLEQPKNL